MNKKQQVFRRVAKNYLDLGWSVIPVRPEGKIPYIPWKQYQTNKPTHRDIDKWGERYPDAQIGVITGAVSDLTVIDFDSLESFDRLEALSRGLPATLYQLTGRGAHAFFKHDPNLRSRTGVIKGIDIKGEGGMAVLAPSIHKSGRQYEWVDNDPTKQGLDKLVELPPEMKAILYRPIRPQNSPPSNKDIELLDALDGVAEGARNDILFRLACWLSRNGLKKEAIEKLVLHQSKKCRPPLSESETRHLIASAMRYSNRPIVSPKKISVVRESITASELIRTDFPEPQWAIPDILPEGLSILGGKPKQGKSFFALNAGVAIATGGKAFGKIKVEKGSVLYLALEDNPRRLKRRLEEMIPWGRPFFELKNLHLVMKWHRMGAGGIISLEEKIREIDDLTLVVIDTLAKFRPAIRSNRNLYDTDYNDVGRLKDLADKHNISILIIHHLRKMDAEDVMDTFSGTLGLTGAADCLLVLNKIRGQTELHITGRDVEPEEYALDFDKTDLTWKLRGKAKDIQSSVAKQKVYDALKKSGEQLSVQDIADLTEMEKRYVKKALYKLRNEAKIEKVQRGIYKILRN